MRRRTPPAPVFDCDQLEDQVLAWRTQCFLDMGFTVVQATRLEDAHADLHETSKLIEDGCPHATALRILR